ncbi:thiolase-like protein [Aspergillus homomorphus CBS 101889]|uniref:Thiolase-like protein n=1 Tax=Aspergillus homomorphus (strain CBS 101889) TaxID=1450537 RepID=A0A395HWD7_ASPHC|nr:thiolase-like protein [Aspergillus homomorphus CBS 101889]RAL11839.1 thiolase-like protein [Aspergillus homomorphus CBS 101889]
MGTTQSTTNFPEENKQQTSEPTTTITGLGTEWPSSLITAEDFRSYILTHYPASAPWVQTLLKVHSRTEIATRALLGFENNPKWHNTHPPTAREVDASFRQHGIPLATTAARKALADSNNLPGSAITHMVSVTVTNAGAPGYDQAVARALGVPVSAERFLLSGVGCAGGLAALRLASKLACAATARGEAARILVLACEVCSVFLAAEVFAAAAGSGDGEGEGDAGVGIGPVLFGDGAAALVLCNALGMAGMGMSGKYAVVDCRTSITPDTHDVMAYGVTEHGFKLALSREVPRLAVGGLQEGFRALMEANAPFAGAQPDDFDWAVHPGGLAILRGAQKVLGLEEEALRASYEVYRTRGNASSVAVLAVLDLLRGLEMRRREVVAVSFGPGLTTEMALLKRLV